MQDLGHINALMQGLNFFQNPALTTTWIASGLEIECVDRYSPFSAITVNDHALVCTGYDFQAGPVSIRRIEGLDEDVMKWKRALREIKFLQRFDHENVLKITDVYIPWKDIQLDGILNFREVYVVGEPVIMNLHNLSGGRGINEVRLRSLVYQLLKAVKYLHSAGLIHGDLAPANIMMNADEVLKVSDLGTASGSPGLTAALSQRFWHKAPEVFLADGLYTKAVDLWSTGCIIAEMAAGHPPFAGRFSAQQLQLITDLTGSPTSSDLDGMVVGERGRNFAETYLGGKAGMKIEEKIPMASQQLCDLVAKMLVLNPNDRITAEEALAHPYVETLRQDGDESICAEVFDYFVANGGDESWQEVQQKIFVEALIYRDRYRAQ